jgi:hypothetical protein
MVVACGGRQHDDTGPEPDPANTPAALAASVRDALVEMTTAAEAHAGDCPGMATALTAVFDRVRPLFDTINAQAKDADRARELTAAFRAHSDEAKALGARLSAAVDPCAGDRAFGEAMARMPVIQ